MNITREDMPGRQVALTIELEPELINSALERAYRQMVNEVNIPGFRRGKAPRYILESYVGKEALTEKAVKNILPDTVQNAITEQNIEAMDIGDVEIVNMDPLQVKVTIVQPPKIELGDYGTIRVEKETTEINDEQIEQVMAELRREGVPWAEPAEPRPIREGDMVYLDLEGFTGEGELQEARREDFPTIVGMVGGGVPEVVMKELIGMSVGEEKDITETIPEDYPDERLQGRDVSYHVKVRSMKEQALPEMDDEFAKTLNYDTVQELREAVEKNLRQRADESAESNQVNAAITQLVEGSTADVPEVMVNEELDLMLKRLEGRLREQRLSLRQYLTYNGITDKEWREKNRQQARERVIRGLVLQEFARREGIGVDDEEVEGEIQGMLERFEGEEKEKAQSVLTRDEARHDLEDRLYQRKIVDRLVGIAEGRIEAAAVEEESGAGDQGSEEGAAETTTEISEEQGTATASDLEEAGGAAEVLGAEGVDVRSENETGEAAGGGTPSSAPRLDAEDAEKA
ncbi:MAG TPA: trigger factor [Chloroflexia bacterium]